MNWTRIGNAVLGLLVLTFVIMGVLLFTTGAMGGIILGVLFFGGAALLMLLARIAAEMVRMRRELERVRLELYGEANTPTTEGLRRRPRLNVKVQPEG